MNRHAMVCTRLVTACAYPTLTALSVKRAGEDERQRTSCMRAFRTRALLAAVDYNTRMRLVM